MVAPRGAHTSCCGQGDRGQQPQDLVGDVEGEEGEGIGAPGWAEVVNTRIVIWELGREKVKLGGSKGGKYSRYEEG